jgi:glucosamine 6-phosphate synthetase-like amidotransferase/phosphosugar isomerase protein
VRGIGLPERTLEPAVNPLPRDTSKDPSKRCPLTRTPADASRRIERPSGRFAFVQNTLCGIAGYSLAVESPVERTIAARALLAGIAERGADAVGYAYRSPGSSIALHKQRSGATALLDRIGVPEEATKLLVHVRDYTKGHPSLAANNHPVRHGAVVGIHNGIIENDDELFAQHGIEREQPGMTVDSEIIFALAERSRGRTAAALEQLYGSMATAWLDESRPELLLARGLGRPLWIGQRKRELFFGSTRLALELVESYAGIKLRKSELPEGTVVAVEHGRIVARDSFKLDRSFAEEPLPAVRAPDEARSCLERLARLHIAAA